MNNDIRYILKSVRVANGISNKEVAGATHVSTSTITTIESKLMENSRAKHLAYLRSKGVYLNSLFDEILNTAPFSEEQRQ